MDMYSETGEMIPMDLQNMLDQEVDNDEQLRWSAQPSVSAAVKKGLAGTVFGVIWTAIPGFMAFKMIGERQSGGDVPAVAFIFIGVFLLIGVLIMLSPLWASMSAKKTVYAVTNKRAIIIKAKSTIDVQSFSADNLKDIIKRLRRDGSGDLIFERTVTYRRSSKGGSRKKVTEIGFFGIPRVNEVEDMIQEIA